MYKFTISQGKKQVLSFVDKNAVSAHTLVKNANKNIKANQPKLSYTYQFLGK